jgi:hypothetical protein
VTAAAILAVWLVVKVRLFQGLEYTSDLFAWVQLPRNWIEGRPLFYPAGLPSSVVHGYYLAPLLGPLTSAWGAYGLFALHAALLFFAYLQLDRVLDPHVGPRLTRACAYLFGPVGFWIWDDPTYGWHIELLYVPLAVLFVAALHRNSRARWVWGALLCLLREDGAIVGCSLHLINRWGRPPEPSWSRLGPTLKLVAGWFTVFAIGFIGLRWREPESSTRLDTAVHFVMVARPGALRALAVGVAGATLLFASGLLLVPSAGRAISIVAAVPVIAVSAVASAYYGSAQTILTLGPTWPTRFAMLWSLVGAAVVSTSPATESGAATKNRRYRTWGLAVVVSLVAQLSLLRGFRDYDVLKRLAAVWPGSSNVIAGRLSESERSFLECLRDNLPKGTVVAAHGSLLAYFHRQDVINPQFMKNAWRPPEVIVCEADDRLPFEAECGTLRKRSLDSGFHRFRVEGIKVACASVREGTIAACVASSGEPVIGRRPSSGDEPDK